jgi:hypothetical protein
MFDPNIDNHLTFDFTFNQKETSSQTSMIKTGHQGQMTICLALAT